MSVKNLGIVLVAAPLAACAVGWGLPYNVEFENSSSVTVRYDPLLASIGEVQSVAQAICDKYGKDAVPLLERSDFAGVTNSSYRCVPRQ